VKRVSTCLVLALLAFSAPAAYAVQPDEVMANPAQEARARSLSRELRCMVCQNQSIDDSEAPLARDIRLLVRERIAAGDSDRQVLDFLVARYGEFVLLKPRFEPSTLPLWLLTPLLLIGGGIALWGYNRRRSKAEPDSADEPRLSVEEEARLAKLTGAEPASGERL
jgi:cytochrome c-type biogenesis protein CcmH